MNGKRIKNKHIAPKVGDRVNFGKTMTVADQAMFTGISGNLGGIYVDRLTAKNAGLKDMAVFELAAAGLFSTCLSRLAGPGYRIGRIQFEFTRAVPIGTTLDACATFESDDGAAMTFALVCEADGVLFSWGEAVLVPVDRN